MKHLTLKHLLGLIVSICALMFMIVGCSDRRPENSSEFSPITEVLFDESMGKSKSQFQLIATNADDMARYAKAKALYEKNLPSKVSSNRNVKIPKIIHQIWLGPKLPPASFAEFQDRIKALHPGWEYHLWHEAELEELNLDNWDLVEKSQNWAEKSDIIRGDLLDRFGGVYMDEDVDLRHSLNELNEKYDFYAGMEPPHQIATTSNRVWAGISIMGARPAHPIIKNWKRRVRTCWDDVDLRYSSQVEKVLNHTYFNFTHAVMQEIDQPGNVDILFPATYFYPLYANFAAKRMSGIRSIREKLYDILENLHLKNPRGYSKIYPESLGVHYWGNTWLPNMDQQVRGLQKSIDDAKKEFFNLQKKVRLLEKQLTLSDQKVSDLLTRAGEKEAERVVSTVETHTALEAGI